MPVFTYLWIIPLLPLLGAGLNGIFGRHWPRRATNVVAIGSTGLALLATLELVREFVHFGADQLSGSQSYFTWIAAGTFRADFALQVDQLTIVMLLVVTLVGWLIHIYSIGYMAKDPGYVRYFSYLNLFMFFMLILVLASNYLLMFVGWEGVGLSSYLLIGFFFRKPAATNAGNKAFWVNRIGDFGFLIALFLMFRTFASLDFSTVFSQAASMPLELSGHGVLTAIALLLFVGATGKSAQLPLYVWLPDAMEGPTPVSALIHAATMVTAGVYMVARSHVIFSLAPVAMTVVAVIGLLTAFCAATIALVQNDIKKVLAYSTISQLGYMFLGCGVGAFSAGIFHLMTHSFFKGLLFLGAGSVIHAMSGEQDLRKMGGLRKKIPWTYWTMLMATLAIAGAPGFSGFFSKDAILNSIGGPNGLYLWLLGVLTAGMTAFYMFRLFFLTFHGQPRFDEHKVHVHESPKNMLAPLVVLAVLSVVGGLWAAPELFGRENYFTRFLSPVFSPDLGSAAGSPNAFWFAIGRAEAILNRQLTLDFMAITTAVALIGFLISWWFYLRKPAAPTRLAASLSGPYRLLSGKYFVDELYAAVIVRPLVWISTNLFWHVVDEEAIDGTVNGVAEGAEESGGIVRRIYSGNTRSYAGWVVLGALVLTTFLIWMAR
ncbi:MAG: NADH-quinone oxidoreductase subunit L [Candidatus Acidiferrales bacterium]